MSDFNANLEPHTAGPAIVRPVHLLNGVALLLTALWVAQLSSILTPHYDDFKQYWQAAVNVGVTGDPFIPPPGQEDSVVNGYYYLPIFAYLIRPLALFTQSQGQVIWFYLNVFAGLAFIWLCVRVCGWQLGRRYWGVVTLCFFVASPTRLNLQLGQITIFTGLLVVGGMALPQRRAAVTGLALALASLIRIFPALLGLSLLLHRRWAAALWSVGWGLAIVAASLIVYGSGPYETFIQIMLLDSKPYPYAAEHNISFFGWFSRLLSVTPYTAAPAIDAPWLVVPLTALCSLAVLGVCLWCDRGDQQLGLGMWLCAMMLVSSTNGYYTLALVVVPLLTVLGQPEKALNPRLVLLLTVSIILIMIPPGWTAISPALYMFTHTGWGLLLLTPSFYGLLGLGALLIGLTRRSTGDIAQLEVATDPDS